MNNAYQVMVAMNNALVQTFAHPEVIENINRTRQNCMAAGGSHEEPDFNSRILICHIDNRPCMMQCMNGATNIRDGIYG